MSDPSSVAAASTSRVVVPAGTTAGSAIREAGWSGQGPEAIVVVRDAQGELRDLAWSPEVDAEVEPVAADTADGRAVIRHSAAHVLAQAVQERFPEAKLGIGPPVRDGFYYDFSVDTPFTPEDLHALEKRMKQIIKSAQRFSRRVVPSVAEAKSELADEPFKLELVDLKSDVTDVDTSEVMEVGAGELTIYDNVDPRTGEAVWGDLCRGPHVPTTKHIPAFGLTRAAAAHWRGDEQRQQLQRIYGTAWESTEAQQRYQEMVAEAERRDHRKLGAELDLFSFPEQLGSGLPVFHPKGGIIRRELENYSRQRHMEAGYEFVNTPHVTKENLFRTSGHLESFSEGMFPPMEVEGTDYYLKAMNCPMHHLIFDSRGRSYRELPLRLFEFGTVYRYEKSGVVHGLTRVRGMTQDDSHIYCTPEQLAGELRSLLEFVLSLLRDYGLDDFYLELSTRDDSPKFLGEPHEWEQATEALRATGEESGLELVPDPGGAAYYGPKMSVQARDAIGRTWQMSTIQVDFQQPKRFELEYTGVDGSKQQPMVIHRALFGSIERFFGVLTEHYAGAFPAWLSPVQVVCIPIADEHAAHLRDVAERLRARGVRVEIDDGDDRMQKKIRTHTKDKVPFLLLAGGKDVAADAVSFRCRDGGQVNGVDSAEAVEVISRWIDDRVNESPTAEALEAVVGQ